LIEEARAAYAKKKADEAAGITKKASTRTFSLLVAFEGG
jgi:hypothetical protein